MVLQEATLNKSPQSHDSSKVQNYKGDNQQNDTDILSSSPVSMDVKEEAKEKQATLTGKLAVDEEEGAMNKQAQIFFCTIPMLESALHIQDADALQTNNGKAFASEIGIEGEGLALRGPNCDSEVTAEVCEMASSENGKPQNPSKSLASLLDISKDSAECRNTESMCQSETLGKRSHKDASKDERIRRPNDSENEEKEVKCSKSSKKKFKVDWTADLHRRFVQAVEYLGVEQAIPSRILEVMKVDGLTRHNVASHLQKYRSHKKHMYAREAEASNWHQDKLNHRRPWNRCGQNVTHTWIQPRPPIVCQPLHVWGHPRVENPAMHLMPQYMTANGCLAFDNMAWRHPMADSWVPGFPSVAPCYPPRMNFFSTSGYPHPEGLRNATSGSFPEDAENSFAEAKNGSGKSQLQEVYPPKELLDAAINEALSNPWMPLPLGLKPPSMESVMAELHRHGINTLSSIS